MTYRIWVHSLPHSGDLRMHEHSDEPFANLVQWNRTCKYKENIVNMERPSNTFGKMRKCQSTELPRPQCWQWAWIENLMPSQIVEHSEHDSWQDHWQKEKAYKHNRNGQHSEAARSMKWAVVDMFAKSEFGTREIRSQVEKGKKTYIWLQYSVFLIKGPRNSQNEFRESRSGHFRAKLKAKKCQRINIEKLKISIFEPGPRKCRIWASESAIGNVQMNFRSL